MQQGTCFVIQGYGEKTDYETGRKLNLDASYEVIREAVEAAGLLCKRCDEVQHAGVIDAPMYRWLLEADLVIADLSTSNVNAFYELGVRHALRPHTTILVAEQQFTRAFDINRNLIRTYKHLGEDIGRAEAIRFGRQLREAIETILDAHSTDSPLYTFLPDLQPPQRMPAAAPAVAGDQDDSMEQPGFAALMQRYRAARGEGDWERAYVYLQDLLELKPDDAWIRQQLALATCKRKPDDPEGMLDARAVLEPLDPENSHDSETLGMWGSVHKRLWERHRDQIAYLDTAIRAYQRGFFFSRDYYNGINYAYLLNIRSAAEEPAPAIADWVEAERVRREVIGICKARLEELDRASDPGADNTGGGERYWVLATLWEACEGIGDAEAATAWANEARRHADEPWMYRESTEPQIAALKKLRSDSPLKHLQKTGPARSTA